MGEIFKYISSKTDHSLKSCFLLIQSVIILNNTNDIC